MEESFFDVEYDPDFIEVEDISYQIIDNKSEGNCLYQTIRVGLAFHNKFETFETIKANILKRMRDLHRNKEPWFMKAFQNETNGGESFSEYYNRIAKPGAWGGTLERLVACDFYDIDICVLYPRLHSLKKFWPARKEMEDECNYRISVPKFTLHMAFVNIIRFYGGEANLFMFLRPLNLQLTITTTFPKRKARAELYALLQIAKPVFKMHIKG